MKILLVNPAPGELAMGLRDIARVEPLGLEIIGASVSDDHEVLLIDMQFDENLHQVLRDFRPDIVGVTGGIVQTYTARRIVECAKAFDPSIHTVIGGHHASLWPIDFCVPAVDVIVIGEGTGPFRELVAAFENGQSIDHVCGLAIVEQGELRYTPPRPQPRSLEHQPLPDRSLTAKYRDRYFYMHESPVGLVQTSMGCTFPCTFCSCRVFTERRFVPASLERIVDDLERLDEEFVIFCDDHSFLVPERMSQLADLIEERGIKKRYFAYSRVDVVTAHPELFQRWADLGLEVVMAGLEAVEDAHLGTFNKRTELSTNEEALELLAKCGVGVSAGFVIMPDFGVEDFERIDAYIEAHPNIVMTELTPFTPLPGTPLYAEVRDDLLTENRELFDLFHFVVPTRLPQEEMYRLLKHYYSRIAWRTIRRMRLLRPKIIFQRHIPTLLGGLARGMHRLDGAHTSVRRPN